RPQVQIREVVLGEPDRTVRSGLGGGGTGHLRARARTEHAARDARGKVVLRALPAVHDRREAVQPDRETQLFVRLADRRPGRIFTRFAAPAGEGVIAAAIPDPFNRREALRAEQDDAAARPGSPHAATI